MSRDSFVFYRSFYEAIECLEDDSQKIEIFFAICDYALNQRDRESELSSVSKAIFKSIKPQIEANQRRFENGSKGGAPKGSGLGNQRARKKPKIEDHKTNQEQTENKPKTNQEQTENKPNVNVNVNDNVNVNVNDICISNIKTTEHDKGSLIITLPLKENEGSKEIFESDISYYLGLYPNVDVLQSFNNMLGWLNANPTRRKTRSGINKFINSWLCREQEKPTRAIKGSNRFTLDDLQALKELY